MTKLDGLVTWVLNALRIGIVFSSDLKSVKNKRSWLKILCNPFLRVFGRQIVSMWVDFDDLKDGDLPSDVAWDHVICRCPVQLNILKNLWESWVYDLDDCTVWRWGSRNGDVYLEYYSKQTGNRREYRPSLEKL